MGVFIFVFVFGSGVLWVGGFFLIVCWVCGGGWDLFGAVVWDSGVVVRGRVLGVV